MKHAMLPSYFDAAPCTRFSVFDRGVYYFYTKATVVSLVEMFEITVSNWLI